MKEPPRKTLPCADAIPQTVPLVCQVGRLSAVKRNDGASACAGIAVTSEATTATAMPQPASLRICTRPAMDWHPHATPIRGDRWPHGIG